MSVEYAEVLRVGSPLLGAICSCSHSSVRSEKRNNKGRVASLMMIHGDHNKEKGKDKAKDKDPAKQL